MTPPSNPPTRNIHKIIKSCGSPTALVLAAIWIGSQWWASPFGLQDGSWAEIIPGRLLLGTWDTQAVNDADNLPRFVRRMIDEARIYGELRGPRPRWKSIFGEFAFIRDQGDWIVSIPLWSLFAPALFISAWAWWAEAIEGRRTRLNRCRNCNYSRTGLSAAAKCPECGAIPESN